MPAEFEQTKEMFLQAFKEALAEYQEKEGVSLEVKGTDKVVEKHIEAFLKGELSKDEFKEKVKELIHEAVQKEREEFLKEILDSARFASFISEKTGISVENINAFVIGGHGDDMVPLRKFTTVAGMPITNFLSKEELEEVIQRTRFGGGEIVNLLKTGSAFYAPAASILEMVLSILWNKRKILSASVYLDGEVGEYYGAKGLCVGVPIVLGKDGVEEIIRLDLTQEEWADWRRSVESVRKLIEKLPL